jgi:septal ring-binding cell division protein DamX
VLPVCEACTKAEMDCRYPSQAGKPGPKPVFAKRKNARALGITTADFTNQPVPFPPVSTTSSTITNSSAPSSPIHSTGIGLEWASTSDTPMNEAIEPLTPATGEPQHPTSERNLPHWPWIFHPDPDTILVENPENPREIKNRAGHEELLGLDSATVHHL